MKRKIVQNILLLFLLVVPSLAVSSRTANADEDACIKSGGSWVTTHSESAPTSSCTNCPVGTVGGSEKCVASTAISDTSIEQPDARPRDCNGANLDRDNCGIVKYLVLFINALSAIVGVVVTAVIIWGGIEYSSSAGDPSKIQAGKQRVYSGIISLVVFIFTYAFLQYIVPGGLL